MTDIFTHSLARITLTPLHIHLQVRGDERLCHVDTFLTRGHILDTWTYTCRYVATRRRRSSRASSRLTTPRQDPPKRRGSSMTGRSTCQSSGNSSRRARRRVLRRAPRRRRRLSWPDLGTWHGLLFSSSSSLLFLFSSLPLLFSSSSLRLELDARMLDASRERTRILGVNIGPSGATQGTCREV